MTCSRQWWQRSLPQAIAHGIRILVCAGTMWHLSVNTGLENTSLQPVLSTAAFGLGRLAWMLDHTQAVSPGDVSGTTVLSIADLCTAAQSASQQCMACDMT